MQRLGLYNNGNKCWLNSMVQFFCGIREINNYLNQYKGDDIFTNNLKELKEIIYKENKVNYDNLSEKEKVDYQLKIKNNMIKAIMPNWDCNRQQELLEFFLFLCWDKTYTFINQLFATRFKKITIFNTKMDENKECKTYTERDNDDPVPISQISSSNIEKNDNIIDKIYLEYAINFDDIDCNDDPKIKLKGVKVGIIHNPMKSNYIFINYDQAIPNYVDQPGLGIENIGSYNFKPIKLYCRFSFNNNFYIIQGIIIHTGGVNGGHYFYREYDDNTEKWTEYNDRDVITKNIKLEFNNFHLDNISEKPVCIIYKKVEQNLFINKRYEQINFNFDNYVKKIEEKLYIKLDTPELITRLNNIAKLKIQYKNDKNENFKKEFEQEEEIINEILTKELLLLQKEIVQQQPVQPLPPQPQPLPVPVQPLPLPVQPQKLPQPLPVQPVQPQGPGKKSIDELSESLNKYFDLFKNK